MRLADNYRAQLVPAPSVASWFAEHAPAQPSAQWSKLTLGPAYGVGIDWAKDCEPIGVKFINPPSLSDAIDAFWHGWYVKAATEGKACPPTSDS